MSLYICMVIDLLPPIKLLSCFLLVGTAMRLIACTLSGKGIMPCLGILKPRYSKLSMAKNDFCALILKPATFSFFIIFYTLFRWSTNVS